MLKIVFQKLKAAKIRKHLMCHYWWLLKYSCLAGMKRNRWSQSLLNIKVLFYIPIDKYNYLTNVMTLSVGLMTVSVS